MLFGVDARLKDDFCGFGEQVDVAVVLHIIINLD